MNSWCNLLLKYFTFEDEILVKAKSCSGDVSPQVFDFTSARAPVPITMAAHGHAATQEESIASRVKARHRALKQR